MSAAVITDSVAVPLARIWMPPYGSPVDVAAVADLSLASDTVAPGEELTAIVLERPEGVAAQSRPVEGEGLSWVVGALLLLFVVVALKFRNNPRYIKAVMSDLTDVKLRQNAFDDTVKETSFLVLLNVQWVVSAGVMAYGLASWLTQHWPDWLPHFDWIRALAPDSALGMGICCGIFLVYELLMILAYAVVGSVFADRRVMGSWLKGFLASQAIESPALLVCALLAVCYSQWVPYILIGAAAVVMMGKLFFIFKGFRIFFSQMSSLLLFLYYLCSLEIVPLVLAMAGALRLCSEVLP